MENVEMLAIIICYYILGVFICIVITKIEHGNVTVENLFLIMIWVCFFWPLLLPFYIVEKTFEAIKNKWDQIKDKEIL